MDAFLSRCELLRTLFASYGQVLEDTPLITQVFSKLSLHWQRLPALQSCEPHYWTWPVVREALQLEDNERRLANWRAPDALLPLGWKKPRSHGGEAHMSHSYSHILDSPSPSSSPPSSPHRYPSYVAAARSKGGHGKGPRPSSSSPPGVYNGPVVCYHCLKPGHVWVDKACPKYDPKWRPTESQKKKAQELRGRFQGKSTRTPSPMSPSSPRSPKGEGKVASTSA